MRLPGGLLAAISFAAAAGEWVPPSYNRTVRYLMGRTIAFVATGALQGHSDWACLDKGIEAFFCVHEPLPRGACEPAIRVRASARSPRHRLTTMRRVHSDTTDAFAHPEATQEGTDWHRPCPSGGPRISITTEWCPAGARAARRACERTQLRRNAACTHATWPGLRTRPTAANSIRAVEGARCAKVRVDDHEPFRRVLGDGHGAIRRVVPDTYPNWMTHPQLLPSAFSMPEASGRGRAGPHARPSRTLARAYTSRDAEGPVPACACARACACKCECERARAPVFAYGMCGGVMCVREQEPAQHGIGRARCRSGPWHLARVVVLYAIVARVYTQEPARDGADERVHFGRRPRARHRRAHGLPRCRLCTVLPSLRSAPRGTP